MNTDYCIVHHDDKMCFLPSRRYHLILIGDIKSYYETWCNLFQLSAHGMSVCTFQVLIQCLYCCQEWTILWYCTQSRSFQPPKQRSGQIAQHREKKRLQKKFQKKLFWSFQKRKWTQTSGSFFTDRLEGGKKSKFESEFYRLFCSWSRYIYFFLVALKKIYCELTILLNF